FRAPLTFVGWGCERKWGVVFISGGRRIRTCSFSVMSAVCFRYTSPRCARVDALVKRRRSGSLPLCAPWLRLCVGSGRCGGRWCRYRKCPHANRRGGTGIIVADACAFHLSNSLV